MAGRLASAAEQLGSADGLVELGSVSAQLHLGPVKDLVSLRTFLRHYHSSILLPLELPPIQIAYTHAVNNHVRELVGFFDCSLSTEQTLQSFSNASRRVGQAQLQKLRPLRDDRVVQRYLHAVESHEAHGWHTLVYGLTLAVYSLPLRQGLLGYAHQTTGASFIRVHECFDFLSLNAVNYLTSHVQTSRQPWTHCCPELHWLVRPHSSRLTFPNANAFILTGGTRVLLELRVDESLVERAGTGGIASIRVWFSWPPAVRSGADSAGPRVQVPAAEPPFLPTFRDRHALENPAVCAFSGMTGAPNLRP